MAQPAKSDEDQVASLQSRIKELEAELASKEKTKSSKKKDDDSMGDATNRAIDEAGDVVRGSILACVEGLRLTANVVTAFAEEVLDQNKPGAERTTFSDLKRNLPGDIMNGLTEAVNRAVDIPSKMNDKFNESYKSKD